MPAEPPFPAATDQLRALRRHKIYANLTLLAAAGTWGVVQVVALPAGVAGYLQAGAEAGMIGGLADWFAVTALFRHPLGLPIPHTNLIPRNQARIADGVARYIDNEFLRHDMLVEQLRKLDVAAGIARLFHDARDRARIVDSLLHLLPRMLRADETGFRHAIVAVVQEGLGRADLKPAVARLMRGIVTGRDVEPLIREACDRLRVFLEARRPWLLEQVGERTRWFVPRFVDRRLTDSLLTGLVDHLDQLEDRTTEEGQGLRRWLRGLPERIAHADGLTQRILDMIQAALSGPALSHLAGALWDDLRDSLIADAQVPDSKLRVTLDLMAGQLAAELDSPSLRRDINGAVEAFLVENVSAWRERIRIFISDTLTHQAPRDFARRLELQVGPDLQFIRINGTAVGCLVGLAIHYVNTLL